MKFMKPLFCCVKNLKSSYILSKEVAESEATNQVKNSYERLIKEMKNSRIFQI